MAEDKIDKETAEQTNEIIRNTIGRALPDTSTDPMGRRLVEHQQGVLQDVLREGFKQKIKDKKLGEVVDTLKPVLGKDNRDA